MFYRFYILGNKNLFFLEIYIFISLTFETKFVRYITFHLLACWNLLDFWNSLCNRSLIPRVGDQSRLPRFEMKEGGNAKVNDRLFAPSWHLSNISRAHNDDTVVVRCLPRESTEQKTSNAEQNANSFQKNPMCIQNVSKNRNKITKKMRFL